MELLAGWLLLTLSDTLCSPYVINTLLWLAASSDKLQPITGPASPKVQFLKSFATRPFTPSNSVSWKSTIASSFAWESAVNWVVYRGLLTKKKILVLTVHRRRCGFSWSGHKESSRAFVSFYGFPSLLCWNTSFNVRAREAFAHHWTLRIPSNVELCKPIIIISEYF